MSASEGMHHLNRAAELLGDAQKDTIRSLAEYKLIGSAASTLVSHGHGYIADKLSQLAAAREEGMMSLIGTQVVYETLQAEVAAIGLQEPQEELTPKGQAVLDTVAHLGATLNRFLQAADGEQEQIDEVKKRLAEVYEKGEALQQVVARGIDPDTGLPRIIVEITHSRQVLEGYGGTEI
jgi:hypothetical protein